MVSARAITMQGFTPAIITAAEKHNESRLDVKILQSQWRVEYRSMSHGHGAYWQKYVKDNYYAKFHTNSYQYCRKTHFNSRYCKILTKSMEHEM